VPSEGNDEFVTLARVVKTQGRHGEVAAEVHSDVPERFAEGMAEVRRHTEEAGRDPDGIAAAVMCPTLVGEGSRERLTAHLARRYSMEVKPHLIDRYCIVGSEEDCARRLRDYAEAGVDHLVFNIGCAAGDELLEQAQNLAALLTVEVS